MKGIEKAAIVVHGGTIMAILDKYSGVENAEVFEDDDSDAFPFG